MAARESYFQSRLVRKLNQMFPGCLVMKNDEQYIQGIPDLTILYGRQYAVLEVKRGAREALDPEPNQAYYLEHIIGMGGFAAFIYPENEEEVLDALQRTFESVR